MGYDATMDYVTTATTGNATNFGEMTQAKSSPIACADSTRGVIGSGQISGPAENVIEYITIQTTGNATDFGDLTVARQTPAAFSDSTRGCWAGGRNSLTNVIDYITIQTTGNATDFGDLLSATHGGASGTSNSTRGVIAGGSDDVTDTNVIEYVTIQTTGNAADFGDLTVARRHFSGLSDYVK